MTFTYEVTREEQLMVGWRANEIHGVGRKSYLLSGVGTVLMCLGAIWWLTIMVPPLAALRVPITVVSIPILWALHHALFPRSLTRGVQKPVYDLYRDRPTVPVTVVLTEAALQFGSAESTHSFAWLPSQRWGETALAWEIEMRPRLVFFILKRGVPSTAEAQALRDLLRAKLGEATIPSPPPRRWRGWLPVPWRPPTVMTWNDQPFTLSGQLLSPIAGRPAPATNPVPRWVQVARPLVIFLGAVLGAIGNLLVTVILLKSSPSNPLLRDALAAASTETGIMITVTLSILFGALGGGGFAWGCFWLLRRRWQPPPVE